MQVFTTLMKMLLNPPTSLMPGVVLDAEEEAREPDLASAVKLLHDFAPCIEPFRVRLIISILKYYRFLKCQILNYCDCVGSKMSSR